MQNRLFELINLFESEHIDVEAICCDYGPLNKALLNRLGITAEICLGATNSLNIPNYKIVNCFSNPFKINSTIKVFLDFSHIFKRLRGQFERTDFIVHESVRTRYIENYQLSPVAKECSFHWIRLLHHREKQQCEENGAMMSLTDLNYADIWPSGFQRMRVNNSSKIFSHTVGAALIAYRDKLPEFANSHLTAIFVSETASWFSTVNNYHPDKALTPENLILFKNFKQTIKNFAHLIIRGKFVKTSYPLDYPIGYHLPKSAIKPIQSSIAISTASLDIIATELNKQKAPQFFSCNTTQDQTESLFGQLRAEGFGNPTPLRVLQLLKARILNFRNTTNKKFNFFENSDSTMLLNNYSKESQYVNIFLLKYVIYFYIYIRFIQYIH